MQGGGGYIFSHQHNNETGFFGRAYKAFNRVQVLLVLGIDTNDQRLFAVHCAAAHHLAGGGHGHIGPALAEKAMQVAIQEFETRRIGGNCICVHFAIC